MKKKNPGVLRSRRPVLLRRDGEQQIDSNSVILIETRSFKLWAVAGEDCIPLEKEAME
jgi:hypothetical protein